MKIFVAVILFVFSTLKCMSLSVIELSEGVSVTGTVLSERSDKIVVDLGFTVLSIPRDIVISVSGIDGSDSEKTQVDLFSISQGNLTLSVKEWVAHLGEAVVLIRTPTGLGSGFFIHEDGFLITNDHVIAGENKVTVTVFEQEGGEFNRVVHENTRIVASSPELDLALLKVEGFFMSRCAV